MKAFRHQKVGKRAMVVAGGLKNDTDRMPEGVQVIGKAPELDGGVEQDKALAIPPAGRFHQYFVTRLSDVDGYQNSRLLRTLKDGHGWFAP